jgi:predicted ATPase
MKLDKLDIDGFKNINKVHVDFDESSLSTVLIGKNGSGKSNLLEAIAMIFRNLDLQEDPPFKYVLEYQIWNKHIQIDADPARERDRTKVTVKQHRISDDKQLIVTEEKESFRSLKENGRQYLPNNVFGYYSGEIKRFSLVFEKHEEDYRKEIRTESSEPALRPLFLARPHHGQFVLLTLFALRDEDSDRFLKDKFGINSLESIDFQFKYPYWIKGKKPSNGNFWGAKGIVGDFLRELSKISAWNEDKLSLTVNDLKSIQALALKNYVTRVKFFKMLEGVFLSDLLFQIRLFVKKEGAQEAIDFNELSEGEQQVLLIIGLLKFMKEKESLFLLDEPETHLNPNWRYNFLSMLEEEFKKVEKSHIIIATHDPLLVGSLTRKQVQVFSDGKERKNVSIEPPFEDPKGLGVDGILTSDLFGLQTTLDQSTQKDLDRRRELVIKKNLCKEALSSDESAELERLDNSLSQLGFIGTVRDPLYTKFLVALRKREFEDKVDFEKLDRDKQAKLVKKAIEEIEALKK